MSPVVPFLSQPRVSTAPLPGPRVNPGAPIEAFGGGVAANQVDLGGVAKVTDEVMQERDRIAYEERQKAIATDFENGATSLLQWRQHAQNDWQQTKGQDAIGIPDKVLFEGDSVAKVIREGLGSDDAKAYFDKFYNTTQRPEISAQLHQHEFQQRQIYQKETTQGAIEAQHDIATQNFKDPLVAEPAIASIEAIVRKNGKDQGMPDDWIDHQVAVAKSKTRMDVLQQMLDSNPVDDIGAKNYLEQHRTEFIGADFVKASNAVKHGSTEGEGLRSADAIIAGVEGQIAPGTIDLTQRPHVQNKDGSVSTVRSISIDEDGKTILIPTVSDAGKILTNDQAVKQYHETGQHLGQFKDETSANAYAQKLHQAQSDLLAGKGNGTVPSTVDEETAMYRASLIQDPNVRRVAQSQIAFHYTKEATATRVSQEAAAMKGLNILEKNGWSTTSVPQSIRDAMGFEKWKSLISTARAGLNQDAKGGPGDRERDTHLRLLSVNDPEAFMATDIESERSLNFAQKDGLIEIKRGLERSDLAPLLDDIRHAKANAQYYDRRAQAARDANDNAAAIVAARTAADFHRQEVAAEAAWQTARHRTITPDASQTGPTLNQLRTPGTGVSPSAPLTVPGKVAPPSASSYFPSPFDQTSPFGAATPPRTPPIGLMPRQLKTPTDSIATDIILARSHGARGAGFLDSLRVLGWDVDAVPQPLPPILPTKAEPVVVDTTIHRDPKTGQVTKLTKKTTTPQ